MTPIQAIRARRAHHVNPFSRLRWTAPFAILLFVLDVLSPATAQVIDPKILSEWPSYTAAGTPGAIHTVGTTAFLGYGGALIAIDVASVSDPKWLGGVNVSSGEAQFQWTTKILKIQSQPGLNRIFVLYSDAQGPEVDPRYLGVVIYDVSRPAEFKKIGEHREFSFARPYSLAVEGDIAYVTLQNSRDGFISVIDFRDLAKPARRPGIPMQQLPYEILIHDGKLYVTYKSYESLGFGNFGIFSGYHTVEIDPLGVLAIAHTHKERAPSNTFDRPNDLVVAGDYVYFAEPWEGIRIIDALIPSDPIVVSRYESSGLIRSIALDAEHRLFIANGDKGLTVLNVSNPNVPQLAASVAGPKDAAKISLFKGGGIIVDEGAPGAKLFSVDETAQSISFQSAYLEPVSESIATAQHRSILYLGYRNDGVTLLNISDIQSPKRVAHLPVGIVNDLAVGNESLVVATRNGVLIYGLSEPEKPVLIGEFAIGNAEKVRIHQGMAYAYSSSGGTELVAFGLGTAPKVIARTPTSGVSDFTIDGGRLYTISPGVLNAFDVSDPSHIAPVRLSGWTFAKGDRIAARDGILFILNEDQFFGEMLVLSISDGNQIGLLGTKSVDKVVAGSLALAGNRLYVGDGSVFDISAPAAPRLIGRSKLPDSGEHVRIEGNLAMYAGSSPSLVIANICSELNPRPISSMEVPSEVSAIQMVDSMAFIAAGSSGVHLIQYADSKSPNLLGSFDTPGEAMDVVVEGNFVFVADGPSGLQVVDAANPRILRRVGQLDTPGQAHSVRIRSHFAYVADGSSLQVLDIQNPRQISQVGSISDNFSDKLRSLSLTEDKAYLCCGSEVGRAFLGIVPISDTKPLGPLQKLYLPGSPKHVAALGNYIFVSVDFVGIMVLRADLDGNLGLVRILPMRGNPGRLHVGDNRIFVAHEDGGLSIVDFPNPDAPQITENGIWAEIRSLAFSNSIIYGVGVDSSGKNGVIALETVESFDGNFRGELNDNKSFSLRLGALAAGTYKIERSQDLLSWKEWRRVTVEQCDKGLSVVDDDAPGEMRTFYRLINAQ